MFSIILLFSLLTFGNSEKCPNTSHCVALSACPVILNKLAGHKQLPLPMYQKLSCGGTPDNPLVCCEKSPKGENPDKKSLLPDTKTCSFGDSSGDILEAPWLALVKVKLATPHSNGDLYEYRCSGSLINKKYVLTSTWCLTQTYFTPVEVVVGNYHLNNGSHCIGEKLHKCGNYIQIFTIEKTIMQRKPDEKDIVSINNLGLMRLSGSVEYNDYVKPVCLPFPEIKGPELDDMLVTNGWEFLRIDKFGETKSKVDVVLKARADCRTTIEDESQMCIEPLKNNTSKPCLYGNIGSPVMYGKGLQWYQVGIVSGTSPCDLFDMLIYRSVAYSLQWIIDNLEP